MSGLQRVNVAIKSQKLSSIDKLKVAQKHVESIEMDAMVRERKSAV